MSDMIAPSVPMDAVLTSSVSAARLNEVKSPTAFRTISEVAADLEVPQHVLRFWESKFNQIKPLKRGGGRRYYRPEDVQVISNIKELLYSQGFTIRGVQKLLKENQRTTSMARSMVVEPQVPASLFITTSPAKASGSVLSAERRHEIEGVLSELKALRELLRQAGI